MDEQAAFETRAILPPGRARRSKLALVIPVAAFVMVALAGVSGRRDQPTTAERPTATADPVSGPAEASAVPDVTATQYPDQVLGLEVHRLDEVQLARLTRDDIIAIAGWYVALAITDCPSVVADLGDALPTSSLERDPWAFCERSGVLYAARTGLEQYDTIGPSAVPTLVIVGVRMPGRLEEVGAAPTQVVLLGHFVEASTACMGLGMCPSELLVDHLAWAPDA